VSANSLVAPGWDLVNEVFTSLIESKQDIGAGVALFHRGECVVNLTGGYFDNKMSAPYDEKTLQLVFSATKGVTALAVAICVERGLLSYEESVSLFWPEFASHGKQDATVAQLLSHQLGLHTVELPITLAEVLDWEAITSRLANSKPAYEIGSTHGYHGHTYGWLAGELVRRADGRNIGRFIAEEIANPLGVEIYVGLPEQLEPRVAPLATGWSRELKLPQTPPNPVIKSLMDKVWASDFGSASLTVSGALSVAGGFNRRDIHFAEMPGSNGITNAYSLAKMYAATIGEVEGAQSLVRLVSENSMRKMRATVTPKNQIDQVLQVATTFGMGFMTPFYWLPMSGPDSFGHIGAGGSSAFADPRREMSFAYVMNRSGEVLDALGTDSRARRLIAAATQCADAL